MSAPDDSRSIPALCDQLSEVSGHAFAYRLHSTVAYIITYDDREVWQGTRTMTHRFLNSLLRIYVPDAGPMGQ